LRAVNFQISTETAIIIYFLLWAAVLSFLKDP
jgi:hypothetical protein